MTDPADKRTSFSECSICSQLEEHGYAFRKVGEEENATYLPPETDMLETIKEINGSTQLRRCPRCGTFYIYTSTYEYLVYGSEDEESLRRISVEEAEKYRIE